MTSESNEFAPKGSPFEPVGADGVVRLSAFSTPIATLAGDRMAGNIRAMAQWCGDRGLLLSPHGKTTMAPSIWEQQLAAGAWAITVANPAQLRVARRAGIRRVIVANEFVDPTALRWVYAQHAADPDWRVICWVDSVAGVEAMAAQHDGTAPPIDVCIEVGALDARGGVRSEDEARRVAEAVAATPAVRLVGVAGYEGVVTHGADAAGLAEVSGYLRRLVSIHRRLADLYETDEVLISAGGSAYFDLVAAELGPEAGTQAGSSTLVVLRPGVYVTYDDGIYTQIAPQARGAGPQLVAAMHVWGRVLSRPQPDLALLDVGRRDISADEGMPVPQRVNRNGTWRPDTALNGAAVIDLNDQHTYLRLAPNSPIEVGDVVRLGLSHPCTTFDKWSTIPVIDDPDIPDPRVTEFIETYF
ncbi:amino acid deaminase [Diaminobutyricibacter tongyongensis]|uniref:Amino acid deaminase n=2 Tax=Leifsonia tongyongensis TaxID=1268043 RepID=A0A6L9XUI7_9MICO|nr:amino acid deaminase [Diaminobutyricibacter tongyongensis]